MDHSWVVVIKAGSEVAAKSARGAVGLHAQGLPLHCWSLPMWPEGKSPLLMATCQLRADPAEMSQQGSYSHRGRAPHFKDTEGRERELQPWAAEYDPDVPQRKGD